MHGGALEGAGQSRNSRFRHPLTVRAPDWHTRCRTMSQSALSGGPGVKPNLAANAAGTERRPGHLTTEGKDL